MLDGRDARRDRVADAGGGHRVGRGAPPGLARFLDRRPHLLEGELGRPGLHARGFALWFAKYVRDCAANL